ncbi:DUF4224 domain-containing protein [Burkholderia sp. BCC1998]|uniref:DUF4224 domain-containing protein n=1 Tax=Burkholderia sp. BCC1998 TaxID=2817447 RepID=UPI002AB6BC09|nr:DUF4224 domain-containing protein [Burkholderia sp. BCC1998]
MPTQETKSDLFLTAEEVGELTGVLTGRRGKSREALQVEWLRTSGIPFWVNARGRPIIARVRITGEKKIETPPKPKSHPKALNPDGTLKLNPDGTLKTD